MFSVLRYNLIATLLESGTRAMNDERDSVELARRLVYLAAERTLTSWLRTALSLMALGFVIDRFGLILDLLPAGSSTTQAGSRVLSTWAGSLIIGLGAAMALAAGIRYLRFAIAFHREGRTGVRHGIYVGAVFSMLLAVVGIALIIVLAVILR
jgi:putative membrane protein